MRKLLNLFWTFFKIGLFTFGGGYAMIPLIEREVVDNHGWLEKSEMQDMIAIAESTPGPVAVNMATFAGYKYGGFWGSVAATIGLALPSFFIILLVSLAFTFFKSNKWVEAAFLGIRAGVVALLVGVVIRLFKDMEKSLVALSIFLVGFFLATFIKIDIVFVILAAGAFGLLWQTLKSKREKAKKQKDGGEENDL